MTESQRTYQNISNSIEEIEKQKLNIILDLNGLLLQRNFTKSSKHQNIRCGKEWITLRPGCLDFLASLVEKYNVGIWSTALMHNLKPIIDALQEFLGSKLPFFVVWDQEKCSVCKNGKIYRPDKLGVETMFKPLSTLGMIFNCDPRRIILIDDSPYKGSINPQENCIYPSTFDTFKEDNTLLHDLLPYLHRLDEALDIRNVVQIERFGQNPVVSGHPLYTRMQIMISEYTEKNYMWLQMVYDTFIEKIGDNPA